MAETNNTFLGDQFVNNGAQYETQSTFFQGITLEQGILYLNRVTMPPTINYPDLSEDQKDAIRDLMGEWNMEFLTPILLKHCVDVDILKILTSTDVSEMLKHVPLGYRVKFNNLLTSYKERAKGHSAEAVENCVILSTETAVSSNFIDIINILQMTFMGRNLLNYYKQHSFLTETHRKDLREGIYGYILEKNIKWTLSLVETIAEQVVSLFPTEIKEVYFNKINNKVGGVLFHNFYNYKRNVILPNCKNNEKSDNSSRSAGLQDLVEEVIADDVEEHINALNAVTECTWADKEIHWKATCGMRVKQFKENSTDTAYIKWPHYKEHLGFKLVAIDYSYLYPSSTVLTEVFYGIEEKLLEIFDSKIKDVASKKLLKKLKENWDRTNKNSRACIMFYLLPSIVIPTTRKVSKEPSGENAVRRFSIKDSQESFITVSQSIAGIESYIQLKKQLKKPIQPLMLIEDDLFNIENIIIYTDNVKYKFENFLDALDSTFKIYQVFNIKYPDETEVLWNFIQKFFYNVKTKYDLKLPASVVQLIADLNN